MRNKDNKPRDAAEVRLALALQTERRVIGRASWLTVLASLLWLAMAAAVATLFGALVAETADLSQIWAWTAVFVGAGGLRIVLGWRAGMWLDMAAERVLVRERAALLTRQDSLVPGEGGPSSAMIAALLIDKLPMLRPYVTRYRPAALRVALIPLIFLVTASAFSWAVALILAVAGPLIPVFMALVGMAARDASERQMDEIGSLSGLLGERLAALVDIRLLDAGDRLRGDFEDRAEGLRARTMAVLRVAFLSSTVLELFSALGVAMVAVYVGFALLGEIGFGTWDAPLSLAEGVFLLMLAPEFFQPLRDLAAAWHDRASALAVSRDLLDIEAGPARSILGQGAPAPAVTQAPPIAVHAVTCGVLRFPDLFLPAGTSLAITGPSGSGKSTLMAFIGGLVSPDQGALRIDGVPLGADNADAWRAQIAWVPQAAYFPSGPLQDGLTMGLTHDPDPAEIEAALRLAAATDVVARLRDGLQTELGETGGGVSGGEARRLLVARAALSARPVILADEPTADLDPQTAAEVTQALHALNARGATLIVATHDMRLARTMAQQVRLGHGAGAREDVA